ncbi:MAG: DUF2680 domain-containing protein [Clostridiales bacterium]|nr:DUF2680 domain-containing protein [Clostridiales bacterium]
MKGTRNFKRVIAIVVAVLVLGTAGAAFAATYKTPAEIVAGLTGQTTEQVFAERAEGKTYGTIANDAGKLEEFKAQILAQKKAILDQRVKDGTLTQAQADAAYNAIAANQAICDGTGSGIGMGCGAGYGTGTGSCGLGGGMSGGMGRGAGKFSR